MKKMIVAMLMLMAQLCHASETKDKKDTKNDFEKNQLSFALTNAMSQEFFVGSDHMPTTVPRAYFSSNVLSVHYLPLYAFHLNMRYTVGIARGFGIETGVGYLFNTFVYDVDQSASGAKELRTEHFWGAIGYISLPLYAKYSITIGKGRLNFKLGPDFNLPVNSRFEYTFYNTSTGLNTKYSYQHRFTTKETGQYAIMGLCAGMVYEKKIRRATSISVGPVIDFFNLAQFHRYDIFSNNSGYHTIQYYIGLDVAINFGFHVATLRHKF